MTGQRSHHIIHTPSVSLSKVLYRCASGCATFQPILICPRRIIICVLVCENTDELWMKIELYKLSLSGTNYRDSIRTKDKAAIYNKQLQRRWEMASGFLLLIIADSREGAKWAELKVYCGTKFFFSSWIQLSEKLFSRIWVNTIFSFSYHLHRSRPTTHMSGLYMEMFMLSRQQPMGSYVNEVCFWTNFVSTCTFYNACWCY